MLLYPNKKKADIEYFHSHLVSSGTDAKLFSLLPFFVNGELAKSAVRLILFFYFIIKQINN